MTKRRFLIPLLICLAAGLAQADFERSFQLDGNRLLVANLVGEIQVVGTASGNFEVEVQVRGNDADESLVRFEENSGGDAELLVIFPTEDHDQYVYPELGGRSRTQIRFRKDRSESPYRHFYELMGDDKIEVRGRGRGLEMWADVTIRVPKGKQLLVLNGVGEIGADDLEVSALSLDTHSGHIRAESIQGDLSCDTGSGHVEVRDVEGEVEIDTGSGHVEARTIRGKAVKIDTGSGHVVLEDCEAPEINVDTGSGSVDLDGVECDELHVDTGSGGVEAVRIGTGSAEIDTGSGGVTLQLTRMGDGPFSIDTGSGGIELTIPPDASAEVEADSGSGGVRVDVDDITEHRIRRDHARFAVGGGKAKVELETGSGRIRIVSR